MWSALARPPASRGAGAAWLDGMNQAGENLVPGVQTPWFGGSCFGVLNARLMHVYRGKLVMQ